ncbi:MAG TPA: OmpA family protein [Bryobacteraceae bacterium]|nr:OmpA family protein [Bryobacteraceae bacterium]
MKFAILGIGIAGIVVSVGCHKAVPVAAKPAAPVATPVPATPAPAPQRAANRPTPVTQPSPQQQTQRSGQLTPAERATLNERLARLEDALFDYDKAAIRSDATTALRDDVAVIRDILANYPVQKLIIEGHADERGSEEYNMALGDRRARAAENFLVTMGLNQNQLTVISYGKDRPRCTEQTEQCWQENRRAHITAAP